MADLRHKIGNGIQILEGDAENLIRVVFNSQYELSAARIGESCDFVGKRIPLGTFQHLAAEHQFLKFEI